MIHKKLKERTWDKMVVQLKAINGLDQNFLVYNYHVRDKTAEEKKRLTWVRDFRRLEIREKLFRKENK